MQTAEMIISYGALWVLAFLFARTLPKREGFGFRLAVFTVVYVLISALIVALGVLEVYDAPIAGRLTPFLILCVLAWRCFNVHPTAAVYYVIWAQLFWETISQVWKNGFLSSYVIEGRPEVPLSDSTIVLIELVLLYTAGCVILGLTLTKWIPHDAGTRIGPRQLISAVLLYILAQYIDIVVAGRMEDQWATVHLSMFVILFVLYLQTNLFRKSALLRELDLMNILWQKNRAQYEMSRENIALINQKSHDLKHQIRAIRNLSREELDDYLSELEDTVQIYETIVKTGNKALDTIMTEKSLICKDKNIRISCVADGSRLSFIHVVDLYSIMGNALDNAMEAVEKIDDVLKRQIDVAIRAEKSFAVITVVNPVDSSLKFDGDLPVTTKKDKTSHGYGLKSILHLVQKYDGTLSVSTRDGCFLLKILIPLPENE